jgi:hypothetical protein
MVALRGKVAAQAVEDLGLDQLWNGPAISKNPQMIAGSQAEPDDDDIGTPPPVGGLCKQHGRFRWIIKEHPLDKEVGGDGSCGSFCRRREHQRGNTALRREGNNLAELIHEFFEIKTGRTRGLGFLRHLAECSLATAALFARLAPDRLQRIPRGYGRSYRQGLETMALFYTIGHSTRSGTEFIDILDGVGLVADVRAIPRSRANPQFNSDALAGALREHGIDYVHLAELGGRRGRARSSGSSPNSFWQNQSFRNYADYAMTEAFQHGFARLRSLGRAKPCAIMCSEALSIDALLPITSFSPAKPWCTFSLSGRRRWQHRRRWLGRPLKDGLSIAPVNQAPEGRACGGRGKRLSDPALRHIGQLSASADMATVQWCQGLDIAGAQWRS